MGTTAEPTTITEHELYQVDRANASAATPVATRRTPSVARS